MDSLSTVPHLCEPQVFTQMKLSGKLARVHPSLLFDMSLDIDWMDSGTVSFDWASSTENQLSIMLNAKKKVLSYAARTNGIPSYNSFTVGMEEFDLPEEILHHIQKYIELKEIIYE